MITNSKLSPFAMIAQLKVYLNRSIGYISLINFVLIFATFKQNYNIEISIFLLAPLGTLLMILFGYIDYHIIYKHEIEHGNKRNDLKDDLLRIEKKLEELKL